MHDIYPVAKLGNQVLIVYKDDIAYIGKTRALEVKCMRVDLDNKSIDPPRELEKHLKFNPWEEITDAEERAKALRLLEETFGTQTVEERIINPLRENRIKV